MYNPDLLNMVQFNFVVAEDGLMDFEDKFEFNQEDKYLPADFIMLEEVSHETVDI